MASRAETVAGSLCDICKKVRHCLTFFYAGIREVKLPELFEIRQRIAFAQMTRQIFGQLHDQSVTVSGAVCTALFILYDIRTDEPVAQDKSLIHRPGSLRHAGLMNLSDTIP